MGELNIPLDGEVWTVRLLRTAGAEKRRSGKVRGVPAWERGEGDHSVWWRSVWRTLFEGQRLASNGAALLVSARSERVGPEAGQ